ncbi:MAG TPA: geranylgeranylglycerol-phosphate geranylgeranyltransferase, partial [Saprospiraceae bacterium]|nr:geranylgeranylglycerol-phosphate geranylgeranyltransferase [Saprospiraceae bacterium]
GKVQTLGLVTPLPLGQQQNLPPSRMAFIRLLRLPNLVIVFLTQFIPYWFALRPAILRAGGIPVLTERLFAYIAAATVLTTLAGYILNDYYDQNIDSINKPDRVVWGRYLPRSMALVLYAVIVTVAHFFAFLADHHLRPANHWPLWVFPGVSFLLFLYAWQLKCTAVMGNFLVSLLCGVVPIILLLPEERPLWLSAFQQPEAMQQAIGLIWLYGLFAFMTNLLREQIKDMEDFSGDAACGCMTLAVLKGPRFAKKPAAFTSLIVTVLIGLLLFFWQQTHAPEWQIVAGAALLFLPALFTTLAIYFAKAKRDFSRASMLVKIIMFTGLFLLLRDFDFLQALK